jgi:PKHD-type hydroxylase
MTLNLTDPSTYEGGDLEFNFQDTLNDKKVSFKESKLQGSITFFPSFVFHRVTPVTKGTRWSLVAWMLGRPYN